jgi:hypothetical protein
MQLQGSKSLTDRLIGVVTFKAPVYREIADDTTATGPAALIVVVVAAIVGILGGIISGQSGGGIVANTITVIIAQLIGWVVGAWLLGFVAKQFFQGKTDTSEMLRITGYTSIFQIVGIIPVIGIIGGILQIVANVIGIREAAEFDTTKAILTAVIAGVIVLIVTLIITGILFGIFAAIFIGANALAR